MPKENEDIFLDIPPAVFAKKSKPPVVIEDIDTPEEPSVTNKGYDLKRNGKELVKTDLEYVYQLVNGTGFVYRLYHKESKTDTWVMSDPSTAGVDKNGKKIKPHPFHSKKAAVEHMHRQLEKLNTDSAYKNRDVTFGDVWEMFLSSSHARANETIRRYNSIYSHHIEKVFGNRPINDIPAQDYNNFFVSMHRVGDGSGKKLNGYSFAYVQSILKFIYLVVNYGHSVHVVSTDNYVRFTNEVKMPDKKKASDKKAIRVLSNSEIKKIQELLRDTDYYLPFLIALLGGLRPAETFALCFEDFDYNKCTVSINKQITEEASGKRVIKLPKTDNSTRTIELPFVVIKEVQKRQKALEYARLANPLVFEQNKMKFIDGREFREDIIEQPNFINVDCKGRYITAHSFSYYTKIIKKDICPNDSDREDFSFYTFRKTHLSNMASNNCPVGELMKRAGHSKMETLYEYYYNRTDESEKKLLQAMDAVSKLI